MTLSFKYRDISRPDGSKTKMPAIPLILGGQNNFDVVALLDSGADVCALTLEIAQYLGLELKDNEKVYGVGGTVECANSEVLIVVKKGHEKYNLRVPVKVVLDPAYNLPTLIGRVGFFENFIISFDQKNLKVTLKKN